RRRLDTAGLERGPPRAAMDPRSVPNRRPLDARPRPVRKPFRRSNRALFSLPHSRGRRRPPMGKRSIVLMSLVLVALAALAGPGESQSPIKIGVIEPLSGPVAASGNYVRMGAEIARDWLNAKGGIGGRKVDLLIEDNKSDPRRPRAPRRS